jgi:ATP-dependent RNA/DNA helicase IGHMBP2
VRDVREELAGLHIRTKSARPAERRTLRTEQRHLRKELRKREDDALRRLLARVDVVLATTSGAGARILDHATSAASFDVVCVDEAGQALEAACLVALLRGKRAVVAGDPFQLAPTVRTSRSAPGAGCGATILDRVFASHRLRTETVRVLNVQYRMNAVISNWSSGALYDGLIVPAASVSGHLLNHLSHVAQDAQDELASEDNTGQAWVLIDTAGCGFHESADDDLTPANEAPHSRTLVHASKSNVGEAEVVIKHIHALLSSGLKPSEIGVISPYSGQVKLLRAKLRAEGSRDLEVSTVDSFQGREKEAIVLSCVRSNDRGEVGFLTDSRRMNVAITRARRHVCIVCDSATVSHDKFLSAMVDYASEHADYRAADCSTTFLSQISNVQTKMMVEDVSAQRNESRPFSPAKCNQRGTYKQVEKGDVDKYRKTASDAAVVKTNRYSGVSEQALRDRLEKEIAQFIRAPRRDEHAFESSLGSLGRLVVHEIAERLGLEHFAEGNGPDRFILIRKRSVPIDDSVVVEEVQTDSVSTETRSRKLGFVHLHDEQDDIEPRQVQGASDETTLSYKVEAQVVSIGINHIDPAEEGRESKANALLREAALARRERAQRNNRDVSPRNGAVSEPAPRIIAADNVGERPQRLIVNGVIMDGDRARTRTSTVAAKNRLHAKLSEASASRKPKGKKK